ncbi:hypothetical protein P7C70_g583, partial [Phenoliferia sp. Uapishka_3]
MSSNGRSDSPQPDAVVPAVQSSPTLKTAAEPIIPSPSSDPPQDDTPVVLPHLRRRVSDISAGLPFHILKDVFFAARDGNDHDEFDHGGELVRWDSCESAWAFALVCRAWLPAAVFALYRSVAIIGGESSELFLRTLREQPERAAFVKSLVIGLDYRNEAEPLTEAARLESNIVVQVLEACPNITQLQIRPFHPSVRRRLLAAVRSKPLTSLVCLPLYDLGRELSLFRAGDLLELVSPNLQQFEMDLCVESESPLSSHISFPSLALVDLRMRCTGADPVILALLTEAGPTLEHIDVYFEAILDDPDVAAAALLPSIHTLRYLSFLTNPTLAVLEARFRPDIPQVFDLTLQQFKKLECLHTSTTEVSSNLFRLLPPSLRRIKLAAFHHSPSFHASHGIIEALKDRDIDFRLTDFELRDGAWDPKDVEEIALALEGRGIVFSFQPE